MKRVFLTQKVGPLMEPLAELVDELCADATRGMTGAQRAALYDLLAVAQRNLTDVVNQSGNSD